MDTLLHDLRYAVRMLWKNPGFTVIAILALALGVGANTAIFTVVNTVLIRPLPFQEPERLVMTYSMDTSIGQDRSPVCMADYLDWRAQNQVFEKLAAFSENRFNYSGDTPEQVDGAWVTADFFETLKMLPAIGRTFFADEDQPGHAPVVVVGHRFWQRHLASDPNIIGKPIKLNNNSFTIIGVMPPGFTYPTPNNELWVIERLDPPTRRGPFYMWGIGRLAPGATLEQARAEMNTIARRVQEATHATQTDWTFTAVDLTERIVGNIRPVLLVLLGAVVLVLLIASANVANLLLARATAREKEIAIRRALGASRARLIRQLLTESTLLALCGGALGLLLAQWGVDLLLALSPDEIPRLQEVRIDGRVLGFTLLISMLCGILFGLAPALQSAKLNLNETLKEGGRSNSEGAGRRRLRDMLVISEIALSLVLLIGAGLLIRSFVKLQQVSPGFNANNILTMHLSLSRSKYPDDNRAITFYRQLLEKIDALPGVQASAITLSLPPNNLEITDSFSLEAHPIPPGDSAPIVPILFVNPTYFSTLGVPLLRGRVFTDADKDGAPGVAIINETLARQYFGDENPIGQRMKVGGDERDNQWMEIVGVVGNIRYSGLDAKEEAAYYVPYLQASWRSMYVVVRTAGNPLALASPIRDQVWSLDSELPVAQVRTMEQLLSESVAHPRFRTLLLGIFAAVALLLAAVGIYGVISYSVNQRQHEIGIRMALGASRADVLRMIVGQGMKLAVIGTVLGLAGAFAATRLLETLLFGISTTDAVTFLIISGFLMVIAALASFIPARRATGVDPMVALRHE